jgi:V/A-type H+-transporting ATPase subunit C
MKSFIDRTNALMLVRGEKERFLSGGNISVSEYIHNGEMIFSQMFPHYSKTDLFVYLETEAKNALMDFVLQTRILASGIEPIIGFFLAKKNSAELIRSIIIGKIHNLPSEQIRKTLTKIY